MKKISEPVVPLDPEELEQYDPSSDMAIVPIGTVAMVAATLAKPDLSAEACVKKAYEILEITALGNAYLAGKAGVDFPKATGVCKFLHHTFHQWDDIDPNADEPWQYIHSLDADGVPLPIPFEEAAKIIIPKAGKNSNRLPLMRQWLMAKYKLDMGDAGDKIAEWKKTGIPFDDFSTAFYSYPKWRKYKTSQERKAAAAKSRKNKGKQGRVKSKKDKRLGARPPVEEMKKMFGR